MDEKGREGGRGEEEEEREREREREREAEVRDERWSRREGGWKETGSFILCPLRHSYGAA